MAAFVHVSCVMDVQLFDRSIHVLGTHTQDQSTCMDSNHNNNNNTTAPQRRPITDGIVTHDVCIFHASPIESSAHARTCDSLPIAHNQQHQQHAFYFFTIPTRACRSKRNGALATDRFTEARNYSIYDSASGGESATRVEVITERLPRKLHPTMHQIRRRR